MPKRLLQELTTKFENARAQGSIRKTNIALSNGRRNGLCQLN